MRWALTTGATLLLTGCAIFDALAPASALWRRFEASYAQVWAASLSAVEPATILVQDKTRGLIVTGWYEGYAQRAQGFLFGGGAYQRRVRYRLTLVDEGLATRVAVLASVEEKAPGGPRAFRWERVVPEPGQVNWMFSEIERRLIEPQGARQDADG